MEKTCVDTTQPQERVSVKRAFTELVHETGKLLAGLLKVEQMLDAALRIFDAEFEKCENCEEADACASARFDDTANSDTGANDSGCACGDSVMDFIGAIAVFKDEILHAKAALDGGDFPPLQSACQRFVPRVGAVTKACRKRASLPAYRYRATFDHLTYMKLRASIVADSFMSAFVEDTFVAAPERLLGRRHIREAFARWCAERGEISLATIAPTKFWRDFRRALGALNIEEQGEFRYRGERYITGLTFRPRRTEPAPLQHDITGEDGEGDDGSPMGEEAQRVIGS